MKILRTVPIFILASLLVGCSSGKDINNNKLVIWAWDNNYNIPIMEQAEKVYKEETSQDIEFDIKEMSNADTKSKLLTSVASNVTKGLPNIMLVDDDDLQNLISNQPEIFVDLSEHIDFKEFVPYKVKNAQYQDGIYAMPFDVGTAGLFYRQDILEKAGFSEEDLQDLTWQDFLQVVEKTNEITGNYVLSFVPNRATHYLQIAMQSAGKWYFDDEGNVTIKNNEVLKEMLPVLKELHDKKLVKPVDYFSPEGVGAVTSGEIPVVISGVWFIPTIKSAKEFKGKWNYVPVPKLENVETATHFSNLGGASWVVLKDAPNKDIAIDFLKKVYAGNQKFYQEILVKHSAIGSYLPARDVEGFKKEDDYFQNKMVYKDFSEWSEKVPSVNYHADTAIAVEAIRSVLQPYYDEQLTLDETLEKAETYYLKQK